MKLQSELFEKPTAEESCHRLMSVWWGISFAKFGNCGMFCYIRVLHSTDRQRFSATLMIFNVQATHSTAHLRALIVLWAQEEKCLSISIQRNILNQWRRVMAKASNRHPRTQQDFRGRNDRLVVDSVDSKKAGEGWFNWSPVACVDAVPKGLFACLISDYRWIDSKHSTN